jgi:hypothetical protein
MDVWPFRLLKGRMASDSTMASSSVCRKRFEPLCCFFCCCVFRGVGDDRVGAGPLPRGCAKKLLVLIDGVWFCAGEAGPEDAEALDEDAVAGGLLDMTPS